MVSIFYRSGFAYNAVDDLLSRDLFEDIYIYHFQWTFVVVYLTRLSQGFQRFKKGNENIFTRR